MITKEQYLKDISRYRLMDSLVSEVDRQLEHYSVQVNGCVYIGLPLDYSLEMVKKYCTIAKDAGGWTNVEPMLIKGSVGRGMRERFGTDRRPIKFTI